MECSLINSWKWFCTQSILSNVSDVWCFVHFGILFMCIIRLKIIIADDIHCLLDIFHVFICLHCDFMAKKNMQRWLSYGTWHDNVIFIGYDLSLLFNIFPIILHLACHVCRKWQGVQLWSYNGMIFSQNFTL